MECECECECECVHKGNCVHTSTILAHLTCMKTQSHLLTAVHQHWGKVFSFPLAVHETETATHFWPGTGT